MPGAKDGKKKSMGKSASLPSIPIGGKRSPLFEHQALLTVDIRNKKIIREAVGGGKTRVIAKKKVSYMAAERGLEWESDYTRAKIAPEPLPSVSEIIAKARQEFAIGHRQYDTSKEDEHREEMYHYIREKKRQHFEQRSQELEEQKEKDKRLDWSVRKLERLPERVLRESAGDFKKKKKRDKKKDDDSKGVTFAEIDIPERAPSPETVKLFADDDDFDVAEMDMPWDDDELRTIFFKFDSDRDNELDVDDLVPLLRYLGQKPEENEVKTILKDVTAYATMEYNEFKVFMQRYRENDINNLREMFKAADKDKTNKLDADEVIVLLRDLGYAPTVQTVHEAMDQVDQDGTGDINFREFEELREYLRKTEGFMQQDIRELRALYERAACGKAELNTEEIWRITMYRGYSQSPQAIAQLAAEVDADGTGGVSFVELLKVIRRVREQERDSVSNLLRKKGDLEGKKLALKDLGIALDDLDYFVSEETVWEILDDCGDCEEEENLTLEELMAFLRGYRRAEGFSKAEIKEFEDAFNAEDRKGTGSIGAIELGRIMRSFGFPSSLQKVQRLLEEIDFDGSGQLEIDEFLKLMRRLLQGEASKRRDVFKQLDKGRAGKIPTEELAQALTILDDVQPKQQHLEKAMTETFKGEDEKPKEKPKDVNKQQFESFYKIYRREVVEEIRKLAGYSPKEITTLTAIFQNYDRDGSGSIERSELQKLIAQYFPDATKSRLQQVEMQKTLAKLDSEHGANMELDFHKFVYLMRKCDDMRDEEDVRIESEVIQDTGLTTEEVEGFRGIFSSAVNWTGELDLTALKELLTHVVELSDEEMKDLAKTVQEIHPHGREVVRFPQFLRLVKRLTDGGMFGVNEAAERVLKREATQKQKLKHARTLTVDKEKMKQASQATSEK